MSVSKLLPTTSQPSSLASSISAFSSLSISEDLLLIPEVWLVRDIEVNTAQILGQGSYGKVYEARWFGTKVAVKKLHDIFFEASVTSASKRGILKAFAKELNILFSLKHPNIVQFYGVFKESDTQTLELSSDSYIVQELMFCSLDVRNEMHPRLNYRNIIDISLGICSGLRYLHERKEPIIHRDLATKNILLSQNGVAKIADLGVAQIMQANPSTPQTRQPGTELYMPPEVKIEGMKYDVKVDIFSFGVIVLEICIGHCVSASEAFRAQPDGIHMVPEIERRKSDFQDLGNHILKPLIMKCLSVKDERPSSMDLWSYLREKQHSSQYLSIPNLPVVGSDDAVVSVESPTSVERELLAKCDMLQEKLSVATTNCDHYQRKLAAYLQEDREQLEDRQSDEHTQKIDRLRSRISALETALDHKDEEIAQLRSFSSPPSSLTSSDLRDQRATLMVKVNTLQSSNQQLESQLEEMRKENSSLKSQLQNQSPKRWAHSYQCDEQDLQKEVKTLRDRNFMLQSQVRELALQQMRNQPYSNGHTSLPESLNSLPSLTGGTLSSLSATTADSGATAQELKKLRKLVEKYKEANINLDMKLKDARLELQHYETRQTDSDISYRIENDRLRAEVSSLQSQLDRAVQGSYRF